MKSVFLPGEGFRVDRGLATLGPEMLKLRAAVDARFVTWAEKSGAVAMAFPPLLSVNDLEAFDYFQNFPHLALCAVPLAAQSINDVRIEARPLGTIDQGHLCHAQHVLPSAACYNVYLHLRGRTIEETLYVTTAASCFRNEVEFTGLERLWGFTMREIVCIGNREAAEAHLTVFQRRISEFATELELAVTRQTATDPFYEPQDARALMQRLAPVKEEFVYGDRVAVASLNIHRNFFGERCSIRTADGGAAFTSCVAFGLERWLHALLDRYVEPAAALAALSTTA